MSGSGVPAIRRGVRRCFPPSPRANARPSRASAGRRWPRPSAGPTMPPRFPGRKKVWPT